jgi:hypothetical protein
VTRQRRAQRPGARTNRPTKDDHRQVSPRLVLVPPYDAEAELSVLAELFDPLHELKQLRDGLTAGDFYDPRHRRIALARQSDRPLSKDDAAYVTNAVRCAFPLTKQLLAAFQDCAIRRHQIRELEIELRRLYDGPP